MSLFNKFRRLPYHKHIGLNCKHYLHQCAALYEYNSEAISFNNPKVRRYLEKLCKNTKYCTPLLDVVNKISNLEKDIEELKKMYLNYEFDKELRQIAEDDLKDANYCFKDLEKEVFRIICPDKNNSKSAVVEVSTGVGGQESMLFCHDIFHMYESLAESMCWHFTVSDYETTDLGGLRFGAAVICGLSAYEMLKYEGGIHRVQRIPKTEKSGRIHTSTVSVSVIPEPTEVDVVINNNDLKIDTMRASGAGGQHVNKTDSAVRVTHLPTGIAVECQTDRSQLRNKLEATRKLRTKLYQIKLDADRESYSFQRKLQVGNRDRSEKIRTYNFPQDRVTDHRLGITVHNLQSFLSGGQPLINLIDQLLEASWKEEILEIINKGVS